MTKRKGNNVKNNPYLISGRVDTVGGRGGGHLSVSTSTPLSGQSDRFASPSPSRNSLPASSDGPRISGAGTKSGAPTLSTNADTTHSDAAQSKAGTSATAGGGISSYGGGDGSTFSSPAPSVRSLTTTLTTVQSAAASNQLQMGGHATSHGTSTLVPTHSTSGPQFSHQFPMSPASALPAHLAPHGHPTTYNTATANNLLTDNASILTLASSSKRRRRNSLDTNASVRALAPSSIFGGSRESLPLSLLNTNVVEPSTSANAMQRPSIGGVASAERASIYSASGVVPNLNSERNSYYASKQPPAGDGGSVRSGLLGHGRNDSVTGSIGGAANPLASPVPGAAVRGPSRRSSGWGEVPGEEDDEDEANEQDGAKSEVEKIKTAEEKKANE
jgi:hypothetical protein